MVEFKAPNAKHIGLGAFSQCHMLERLIVPVDCVVDGLASCSRIHTLKTSDYQMEQGKLVSDLVLIP